MTFFPLSRKALAMTFAIAALAGVAVALTRPKSIDSAVLGSEWQCTQDRFRDHDLRVADPAAGSACVGDRESRSIHLWPDSIAGKHVTHLSSNLGPSLPNCDFHHRQARGRALMSRALGISGPSV